MRLLFFRQFPEFIRNELRPFFFEKVEGRQEVFSEILVLESFNIFINMKDNVQVCLTKELLLDFTLHRSLEGCDMTQAIVISLIVVSTAWYSVRLLTK